MGQHARPVGPTTTNNAAPFGPEMVQGAQPHRPADRPLWARLATRATVAVPPEVQAFGIETVFGAKPERPRVFLAPRLLTPLAQTTHVQAAFGPEMVKGDQPDRNRERLPLRVGWSVHQAGTHVQAAFTIDMVQGARPDRARPHVIGDAGWAVSQVTFLVQMTPEMFKGSRPDRPRIQLAPRIPLPPSQPTHVQAAFGQEMVAGWHADRGREFLPQRVPYAILPPEVLAFSVEMAQGSRPERPRIFLAPRLLTPLAQTTHVAAPFSPEMVTGDAPPQPRERLAPRTVCAFEPPDVFAFSVEMVIGSRPDRPRIFLAPRLPLPLAQPTHVQAAFTQSMITGERGQRFRERLGPKTGGILPPDVIPFSIEMIRGSRPDRPRLFLAPRIPLPVSQPTHTDAPFGLEMAQGYVPERMRKFLHPNCLLFPSFVFEWAGVANPAEAQYIVRVGPSDYVVRVLSDDWVLLVPADDMELE